MPLRTRRGGGSTKPHSNHDFESLDPNQSYIKIKASDHVLNTDLDINHPEMNFQLSVEDERKMWEAFLDFQYYNVVHESDDHDEEEYIDQTMNDENDNNSNSNSDHEPSVDADLPESIDTGLARILAKDAKNQDQDHDEDPKTGENARIQGPNSKRTGNKYHDRIQIMFLKDGGVKHDLDLADPQFYLMLVSFVVISYLFSVLYKACCQNIRPLDRKALFFNKKKNKVNPSDDKDLVYTMPLNDANITYSPKEIEAINSVEDSRKEIIFNKYLDTSGYMVNNPYYYGRMKKFEDYEPDSYINYFDPSDMK